jgi:hypothetical protein
MYKTLKNCFLIFCAFYFTVNIKSQSVFGLQGGINITSLAGPKSYTENKLRFGTSVYAFFDIPLGNFSIVSLETGLAVSQQGMTHIKYINNIGSRTTLTVKNKLDYILVPIYLKENLTNFYTKLGPYGAYLINASSQWHKEEIQSFKTISDSLTYDNNFVNNLKPFDLGVSFGIGYIYYFSQANSKYKPRRRGRSKQTPVLNIDFRYNLGLFKIGKSDDIPDMGLRNQTFTLALTITSVRN